MLYVIFLFYLFVVLFPSLFDFFLSASVEMSLHVHHCPSALSPCSITDMKWSFWLPVAKILDFPSVLGAQK